MSDAILTDLGPFFERYDRRKLWLMVTGVCASVAVSAVLAMRLLAAGAPNPRSGSVMWGTGVVFTPLFMASWCTFLQLMDRRHRRTTPLQGSPPAGSVDAGNAVRIANAGLAYILVVIGAMLTSQILMALSAFGLGLQVRGDLVARGIMLTVGAAAIYLGNLWPRMPVSRAPAAKAAMRMRVNRYVGWFMVALGLVVALWGLFNPYMSPPARPREPPFVASRHKEIVLSAADLDKFVGRYDFGSGFVVSVTYDGATLRVLREHSAGARAAPIYPETPNAFFWKAVEAQIRFISDAHGAVTGAEFQEGGLRRSGKRLTP